MKTASTLLLALAAALLGSGLALTPARADDEAARARELARSGRILPLERITELALAVRAGRLLDIELEEKAGRYVYEVEILDARGRTWEIELDAATGAVLELGEDD